MMGGFWIHFFLWFHLGQWSHLTLIPGSMYYLRSTHEFQWLRGDPILQIIPPKSVELNWWNTNVQDPFIGKTEIFLHISWMCSGLNWRCLVVLFSQTNWNWPWVQQKGRHHGTSGSHIPPWCLWSVSWAWFQNRCRIVSWRVFLTPFVKGRATRCHSIGCPIESLNGMWTIAMGSNVPCSFMQKLGVGLHGWIKVSMFGIQFDASPQCHILGMWDFEKSIACISMLGAASNGKVVRTPQ